MIYPNTASAVFTPHYEPLPPLSEVCKNLRLYPKQRHAANSAAENHDFTPEIIVADTSASMAFPQTV